MRQATPDDAERLSAIARSAKASWGYPEAWLRAWDSALRITRTYIERNAVFVLAHGREAIGFYALEDRGAHWLLEHLWVDPSQHRRGAGRRLFLHALERVRALRPGVVVIESDPNAVGFYTKMGAVPTGALAAPVVGDASRTLPVLEILVKVL